MTDMLMALRPRISEKSYGLAQERNTYMFLVPTSVNKHEISDAVAAQFKVTVTNVNVANSKGKAKRTVRKGGRPIMGKRADTKKAYVTLKTGDTLPVFAAIDESNAETEKPAAKKDKK